MNRMVGSGWIARVQELLSLKEPSDIEESPVTDISVQALSAEDRRLTILLSDYQMARDDERTFTNIQAAFFGLAIALLAGLATLISNACQFQVGHQGAEALFRAAKRTAQPSTCSHIPDAILAAAPLVPLAVVGFMQFLGTIATIRNYYLRILESELRDYAGEPFKAVSGIGPAWYMEFLAVLVSLRRGQRGFRALNTLVIMATLCAFGGFIVYIASALTAAYRIAMGIIYGASALLLIEENIRSTLGGRGLFLTLVSKQQQYASTGAWPNLPAPPARNPSSERRLISYLLLPRPEDWIKWLFFPIAFLMALLSARSMPKVQLAHAAVFFVVLEYLLYEARYQWNDIRGFGSDQRHPFKRERRRLPGPEEQAASHVAWSSLFIALRLAGAAAILWVFPDLAPVIRVAAGLVFGFAVIYEIVRSLSKTDGSAKDPLHLDGVAVAIWGIVGIGYAVRGVFGVYFGLNRTLHPVALALSAIMLWSFGVMVVTITWALEAMAYCHRDEQGLRYIGALESKNHLVALLAYAKVEPGPGAEVPLPNGGKENILASRGQVVAPWNLALIACASSAGALGAELASSLQPSIGALLASTGLGLVAGCLLAYVPTVVWRGIVTIAGVAALYVLARSQRASSSYLEFMPWLLCGALYSFFRQASYADLKAGLKPAATAIGGFLKTLAGSLAWLAVGKSTWKAIHGDAAPPPWRQLARSRLPSKSP
jgi:hypothetical protein